MTATGCRDVIAQSDFEQLKDGAILANSGHFDVEIAATHLDTISTAKAEIRPNLVEYGLPNGKRVYHAGSGAGWCGQSAPEASPADIMDMTFALMAMTVEWAIRDKNVLVDRQLYLPPADLIQRVALDKTRCPWTSA